MVPASARGLPPARWLLPLAALSLGAANVRSDPLADWVGALYQPLQGETVALSHDGKYVAYSRHDDGVLSVVILPVDNPSTRVNLSVATDRPVPASDEKQPARLRFLHWFASDRLVIAPDPFSFTVAEDGYSSQRYAGPMSDAPVFAADADGHNERELVNASDFTTSRVNPTVGGDFAGNPNFTDSGRQLEILGPAADDPNGLLVEAVGSPTTVAKVDVRNGKLTWVRDDFSRGQLLCDWNGKPRILYDRSGHSLERRFMYWTSGLFGRWRPLGADFMAGPDNYYGHRSLPLGIDFNPNLLYFASNMGRDTFGVYQLDLTTGRRTQFAVEVPNVDLGSTDPAFPSPSLVFDEARRQLAGVRGNGVTPFTLWLDPEIRTVQHTIEGKFPGQTVEILQWDDARDCFLVRVSREEPWRYFIFDRSQNLLTEFLRSAPWLGEDDLSETTPFEFDTDAGIHLSGYLTYPRRARVAPPPLLVAFPSGFLERALPGFDPEAQVYAAMGFAVLRVNCRGSSGFGISHRDAILAGLDRVPIDDMLAAVQWVEAHRHVDIHRIAAEGDGFGGYLALRALQLHPDRFRCAVAIEAPLDLGQWLQPRNPESGRERSTLPIESQRAMGTTPLMIGPTVTMGPPPPADFGKESISTWLKRGSMRLADASVLRHPELLTQPIFLLSNPVGDQMVAVQNQSLRSKLSGLKHPAAYMALGSDYDLGVAEARARVFLQIEEFLNANVYDFNVKIGPMKEMQ